MVGTPQSFIWNFVLTWRDRMIGASSSGTWRRGGGGGILPPRYFSSSLWQGTWMADARILEGVRWRWFWDWTKTWELQPFSLQWEGKANRKKQVSLFIFLLPTHSLHCPMLAELNMRAAGKRESCLPYQPLCHKANNGRVGWEVRDNS